MEKRNKLFHTRFGLIEEMIVNPDAVFLHDACRYSAIIRNMAIYINEGLEVNVRSGTSPSARRLNDKLSKIGCGCTGCKDASANMIYMFMVFTKVLGKNYAKMG